MAKSIRKYFPLFVLAILVTLCMPARAQAASKGSSAKGATDIYKNMSESKMTVITISKPSTFKADMKAAVIDAYEHATKSHPYKIVIAPGTYETDQSVYLPGNTWLYAKGATIIGTDGGKGAGPTSMIRNFEMCSSSFYSGSQAGKSQYVKHVSKNIKIEGGTWKNKECKSDSALNASVIRFSNVRDLIITDVTIKCKKRQHIVEVSDINGMTMTSCKISGNTVDSSGSYNVQPKEALQLDVATQDAMPYCKTTGKGCHNVIVKNNSFKDVARGLGSHNEMNGVEKNPYTNITVQKNTVQKCFGEGIFVQHWSNCTIKNNTVKNARRAGIYVKDSKNNLIQGNKISNIKSFTGKRKKEYGSYKAGIALCLANSNKITKNTLPKAANKGKVYDEGSLSKKNAIKNNKKK